MRNPEVIDAEFSVVATRWRPAWGVVFYWAVGVVGCSLAARAITDRGEVTVYIVLASLAAPMGRLTSACWRSLSQKTSEQEALLMRSRLLDPGPTIWAAGRLHGARRHGG